MQRCLDLALLGAGKVSPNPMVGAVLVYGDRIIGEGYHQAFGGPHGEVNCIASVQQSDRNLISQSTLYVSLEPCAHFGKTPPCADLIIRERIPRVVIGCRDPFPEVDGKGIERLRAAGVEVVLGNWEAAAREVNKRFLTFHERKRPFIILKWAETADHFMAAEEGSERLLISNEYSNRLVHRWRSEEDAIMIGGTTARLDDPRLNTRLWTGKSPVRIIIDRSLSLPSSLKVFDGSVRTLLFNNLKEVKENAMEYYRVEAGENFMEGVLKRIWTLGFLSVLVEGGAGLLNLFLERGEWDEARVIQNTKQRIGKGLASPRISDALRVEETQLDTDRIIIYRNEV